MVSGAGSAFAESDGLLSGGGFSALDALSGAASVFAPSAGFDPSVEAGAVAEGAPAAGAGVGGTALFAGAAPGGGCAAGCAAGLLDGVLDDEVAGAGAVVDPGEDGGVSPAPGCSSVIAGFFAGGFSQANPWFFQRR